MKAQPELVVSLRTICIIYGMLRYKVCYGVQIRCSRSSFLNYPPTNDLRTQVAGCLSRIIGASPSLTGVSERTAACLIALRIDSEPLAWSFFPPVGRTIVVKAAISGAWGIVQGGNGSPRPNATTGSSVPNERIHCPTAARETRTSQEPPS